MTDNIVERAAKAHFEERGFALPTDADWEQIGPIRRATLIKKMQAALAALREPSEAMIEAGNGKLMRGEMGALLNDSRSVWRAMIDQLLSEISSEGNEGRASLTAADVACPTCDAPAGRSCRTKTGWAARTHAPRFAAAGVSEDADERHAAYLRFEAHWLADLNARYDAITVHLTQGTPNNVPG